MASEFVAVSSTVINPIPGGSVEETAVVGNLVTITKEDFDGQDPVKVFNILKRFTDQESYKATKKKPVPKSYMNWLKLTQKQALVVLS